MATFTKKVLKDGLIRYSIQACIKDPITGKNKYPNVTWTNPDRLTGVRAERAAHAFGEAWEKELRNGKPKSCLSTATFNEISQEWLNVKKCKMSASYYVRSVQIIKKLNMFFKSKRFAEITARDVQCFFTELNNHKIERIAAKLKDNARDKFEQAALSYGMRKADSDGIVSRAVLYGIRHGEDIHYNIAKRICEAFNLNVNECFETIYINKNYRKETIMAYKRILSSIYSYAIRIELVTVNYASSVYLKDVIAGEVSKDIDVLNEEEIADLLAVLDKEHIARSIPIYLMLMLGLRCCEACGLEFKDIDFKSKTLTINRNRLYLPQQGIVTGETKTVSSKRTLPISNMLLNKLQECKAFYELLKSNDPLFKDSDAVYFNADGSPANPQNVNKLLNRFLAKAKCKQVTCHKLRHTFITRLISKGVSPNIVSKLAGHANCNITLAVYTHYYKDFDISKDVLNKIFEMPKHTPL